MENNAYSDDAKNRIREEARTVVENFRRRNGRDMFETVNEFLDRLARPVVSPPGLPSILRGSEDNGKKAQSYPTMVARQARKVGIRRLHPRPTGTAPYYIKQIQKSAIMITKENLEALGFHAVTTSILPTMLKGNTHISFMGSRLRILVHTYRENATLEIENDMNCLSRVNTFLSFANSSAGKLTL